LPTFNIRFGSGIRNPTKVDRISKTGRPSEVVREALRLMETQDELRSLKLEQLRRDIREGLDSGPARPFSASEMKREGRKLLRDRSAAAK
jgi:putative addiction module CopG family antidote